MRRRQRLHNGPMPAPAGLQCRLALGRPGIAIAAIPELIACKKVAFAAEDQISAIAPNGTFFVALTA